MDINKLNQTAIEMRNNSIAPYSNFTVGAALLCENGKVYTGCNIESAAFSPTCCAERVALLKALSEGETKFVALSLAAGIKGEGNQKTPVSPCGVCRQMLFEYCNAGMPIYMIYGGNEYITKTISELLPLGFGSNELK